MKKISVFLAIFLASWLSAATPTPVPNTDISLYAQTRLSLCGTLGQTSEGLIYLKVSDKYIRDLLPRLQKSVPGASDLQKPPYFGPGKVGAHISVIYPAELPLDGSFLFKDAGQKLCFTLGDVYEVIPPQGVFKKVYYLQVHSEDLEKLREQYRLPPQYKDWDLHITIGVEY